MEPSKEQLIRELVENRYKLYIEGLKGRAYI